MELKIDRNDTTNNVLHGCLAGFVCMVAASFLVYFVSSRVVPKPSADAENAVELIVWLVGLGIGGYIAARRANTTGNMTGYRTSLNVGLLALLFLLARLPDQGHGGFANAFLAVLQKPVENWRHIAAMAMTVPAALLGSKIAQRSGSRASKDGLP